LKGCGGAIEAVQRGGGASELCLRLIRLNLRLIIQFLLRPEVTQKSINRVQLWEDLS
jgi:hypothetical protein